MPSLRRKQEWRGRFLVKDSSSAQGRILLILFTVFSALSSAFCSESSEIWSVKQLEPRSNPDIVKEPNSIGLKEGHSLSLSPNGLDNLPPPTSKFSPNGQFSKENGLMEPLEFPNENTEPKDSAQEFNLLPSLQTMESATETTQPTMTGQSNGLKAPLTPTLRSPSFISKNPASHAELAPDSKIWVIPTNPQLKETKDSSIMNRNEPILASTTWRVGKAFNSSQDRKTPPTDESGDESEPEFGFKIGRKLSTTTTASPVGLIQRTLHTPLQFENLKGRVEPRASKTSTHLMYPEWLSSSDNSNKTELEETQDYDTSLESGGNYKPQEESPWREMSYFGTPLQHQRSPPYIPSSNEDAPEREGLSSGEKERRRTVPSSDPSTGLADVISRGRIDSVMYVYFGDKFNDYHKEEIAGRIIQAVGGVLAAIAHVLTVLGAAKCIRKGGQFSVLPVQLHIGFALLISNLLLLLAVHATEPLDVCATVAVVLHYLHLVVGAWLLAHSVQTYRALRHHVNAPNLLAPEDDGRPQFAPYGQRTVVAASTLRYCAITWASPFPFILMSYLASPEGYETRRYCWMSIEKGMVVSFIVPVFLLIGLNTLLVILSLRHLLALRKLWEDPLSVEPGDEETLDEKAVSTGIRASAMLLPLLAIMWFLGVVALENPTSIFFQTAAALGNIALSWLVMYFLGDEVWPAIWCPFFKKGDSGHLSSSIEESGGSSPFPSVQPSEGIQLSFDGEPLLSPKEMSEPGPSTSAVGSGPSTTLRWPHKNRSNWSRPGGNEIYELRHDAISTIYK